MMKIFHTIQEGSMFNSGFNLMKTLNGHSLHLQIHFPKSYRLKIGYYWGNRFNFNYSFYNHLENERKILAFTKGITHSVEIHSDGRVHVK